MDGNRGAKGSIKDRLISMLYRIRYKKKVLKEDDYTLIRKENQLKYLHNLKSFNENENVNILDDHDKLSLDKIHYNVNFAIGDDMEFHLKNIESSSSESEKVNVNKEIKKTKDEITILSEINTFVKKSIILIDEISVDINSLHSKTKTKNQSQEELEENTKLYKNIKDKMTKLKEQYEAVKDKYDFSEFSIFESIKLLESISEYKTLASINEADMMLKVCKKEISRIDSITIIYERQKKIGSNIDEVNKVQKQVKIVFHKNKEKIDELKSIENKISSELMKQQQIVDEMYSKASYMEKTIKNQIEYTGYGKIFSSMINIVSGILTLPLSGLQLFGVALGTTMINKGLKQINKGLDKKEKFVVDYEYEDLSYKISQVKDKLEYTRLILSDSLSEIKKIKNNFKTSFEEFKYILPNYMEIFEKVNSLEDKLLKEQDKINKISEKTREEEKLNNKKMEKVKNKF